MGGGVEILILSFSPFTYKFHMPNWFTMLWYVVTEIHVVYHNQEWDSPCFDIKT